MCRQQLTIREQHNFLLLILFFIFNFNFHIYVYIFIVTINSHNLQTDLATASFSWVLWLIKRHNKSGEIDIVEATLEHFVEVHKFNYRYVWYISEIRNQSRLALITLSERSSYLVFHILHFIFFVFVLGFSFDFYF